MRIGLLIIATNKYTSFLKNLLDSAETYFLKNTSHDVEYNIFTNSVDEVKEIFGNECYYNKINIFNINHRQFPYTTLYRYHFFNQYKEQINYFDNYVYIDADSLIKGLIGDDILGDRVSVEHGGFQNGIRGSYETNPNSTSYVFNHEGVQYYGGGFWSFSNLEFWKFVNIAVKMIDDDCHNGIIPLWHDESVLNRYLIDNPPTKVLNSSYHYPEPYADVWKIEYSHLDCKILILEKNHDDIRSDKENEIRQYTVESTYGNYIINLPPYFYKLYNPDFENKIIIDEIDEFIPFFKIRDYFLKNYSLDDIYVDVGANIGLTSVGLAVSGVRCICFEPVTENLKVLNKSISDNKLIDKINVYPVGLYNQNVNKIINIPTNFPDNSSLHSGVAVQNVNKFINGTSSLFYEDIKLLTFDSINNFNKNKVKLIKIDVQGFEDEVIEGMSEFLINCECGVSLIIELEVGLMSIRQKESKLFEVMSGFGFSNKKWDDVDYLFIKN